MDDPILIPVKEMKDGRGKITIADQATIEHEAIWTHCFESLPNQFIHGAWLKGSVAAQEWMRVLLAAHGAEIRKD